MRHWLLFQVRWRGDGNFLSYLAMWVHTGVYSLLAGKDADMCIISWSTMELRRRPPRAGVVFSFVERSFFVGWSHFPNGKILVRAGV